MSHLLANRPDDLASIVKYIGSSFLQVSLEVQMRHWFSTHPAPSRVFAAMWAEVDAIGQLDVPMYFGDEAERASPANEDGLIHVFEAVDTHEGLSIALQQLALEWASEDTVVRMLSDAHARLTKEMNQIHGVVA